MKNSSMITLGVCFAASALGRMVALASDVAPQDSANQAIAKIEDDTTTQLDKKSPGPELLASKSVITGAMAQELSDRLESLDSREDILLQKRAELEAFQSHIERRLEELTRANNELQQRIDQFQGLKNDDVKKLATIYDNMKPQLAGQIMAEMDTDFAAGLLGIMDAEKAAAIISVMDPQKANIISLKLATKRIK